MFAKPPIAGIVKTRLAASVGPDRAAALALAFVRDAWQLATSRPWARTTLATTVESYADFGLPERPELWLQGEGDLGQRIVRKGLASAQFVIAIGAESPALPTRLLDAAYEYTHPIVDDYSCSAGAKNNGADEAAFRDQTGHKSLAMVHATGGWRRSRARLSSARL